jgi:hypothetical protein
MAPTGDSRPTFAMARPLRSGDQLSLLTIDCDPTGNVFGHGDGFASVALCFAAFELGTQSGKRCTSERLGAPSNDRRYRQERS